MSTDRKRSYEFDSFRLDAKEKVLFHYGQPVPLSPKLYETLKVLVEHAGHVVEKDELIRQVWPDTFVDENNLSQCISTLRRILGDGRHEQRYIETVPRRGYRFAAGMRELMDENRGLLTSSETKVHLTIRETREEITDDEPDNLSIVADPEQVAARGEARGLITPKRMFGVTAIGAVLIAVVLFAWHDFRSPEKPLPVVGAPIRSIAVLPFKTLRATDGEEYLGLGMADTLITKLSNIAEINVRPTSAIRKYADQQQDSLSVGREQRVDAVLEGSIQRSDGKIRITVRLLSVRDGSPLWAYKCDQVCTDLFEVQDSISEEVARALMLKLTGQERERLTKRHTESLEAYHEYLKGRYFWNRRTPEDLKKAIEHFQQAIRIDPKYALSYAGLADCYMFDGSAAKRDEALGKALELDDTLVEAITTQAFHLGYQLREWSNAEQLYKRAIGLNPNYATAHHWYAFHYAALGRFAEAIDEINRAKELDPLSLIINTDVGNILYFARQYDQAIEVFRSVLDMDPNFSVAHWHMGEAYEQKHMYQEAVAEFQKAMNLSGNRSIAASLGHAYAVLGRKDKAQRILGELKRLHKRDPQWFYQIAIVYEGLGEKEQALEWLERGAQPGLGSTLLKVDPTVDSLRSDPRFHRLLNRLGLAQ